MIISIIVVTHLRNKLLKLCLDSIFEANHTCSFEVIIVINGESENTVNLITTYSFNIKTILIEKQSPAASRNLAIKASSGEYLCFLDDDVTVPTNYFDVALGYIDEKCLIFGGPDQSPLNSTFFEKLIGLTLHSSIATAHTRFRHLPSRKKVQGKEGNLILCNLWIKSDILKYNNLYFDSRFFRNEENILLCRLSDASYDATYASDLLVFHKRKDSLIHFVRSVISSGFHRIMSFYSYPSHFSFIYLIPMLTVFITILLLSLGEFTTLFFCIIIYSFLNLIASITTIKNMNEILYIPVIMLLSLTANISYSLGSLYAMIKILNLIFNKGIRIIKNVRQFF